MKPDIVLYSFLDNTAPDTIISNNIHLMTNLVCMDELIVVAAISVGNFSDLIFVIYLI